MISPRADFNDDIRSLYTERIPSQSIPSEADDSSTLVDLKQRVQELEGMLKELGVKLGDDDTDESDEGSSVHIFTDDPELGEAPVATALKKSPSETSLSRKTDLSPEELLSQELASVDMTHCLSSHFREASAKEIRSSIEEASPATLPSKTDFYTSAMEEGIIFDRNLEITPLPADDEIPGDSDVVAVSAGNDGGTDTTSEEGMSTRDTIVIFIDKLEIRLIVVYLIPAVVAIAACVVILFYVIFRT